MTDYPYMSNTKKLQDFIDGIPSRTVPEKVTQDYLRKAGFVSSGDRPIVRVLRFIGFIDDGGVPTENYAQYTDTSKQKGVMARCLRQSYSALFEVHADACRKDNETLTNFFRTETALGTGAVNYMILTFKTLCDMADFEMITEEAVGLTPAVSKGREVQIAQRVLTSDGGLTVNLNIQLVLPTTENVQIYESIFKLLKEHVLKRNDNE